MALRGFGSDNHSGIHPDILSEMLSANHGHEPSYGTDTFSETAIEIFRNFFGPKADVYFVYNGTAANVLCLRAGLKRHESCLVTDQSHLNIDECAAPEFFAGKLIPATSMNGKFQLEQLQSYLVRRGDQHVSPIKMISLTQPTELGTCYTIEEIRKITEWAHQNNIYVHIDGARLTNALHFLKTNYQKMLVDTGVDIISLGGTKNGLGFGEAVVILNPELKKDFKFIRKQSAQLPSKTRFISSQFMGYFKNDLYLKIAEHSHQLALKLAHDLKTIPEVQITQPVESNSVFAIFPKAWIGPLRKKYFFYVWNEVTFECRLMLSWDSTPQDVAGFIEAIQEIKLNS